ncbi:hypothetical protein A0H81_00139 [Grifola frondosa]|uniref:UvrD-like helicase C-terminal domain-containing protein n=1 Tax=Grifola frondosa TaxID=5627 RepID=A0A1C7MQI0_GRIFR|nr:hypothetical protein A0H81_00139 [Grifola frondosa]
MIMTLYECKGLEFNDVFLYNFFKDSTVDHAQWRVVFNILHNDISAFLLDQIRDSSVCRELKFLYVAITRARTNLFLTDCSERAEPMRDIWTMREQVRIWAPGDYMPRLAMGSSLSAWAERAHNLFDNKKYEAAMHAFERARLPHEKHIAESYHLRDLARSTNLTNDYLDAAEKFMESAKYATLVSNRRKYLRIAGGCFADAKAYGESANAYAEAEEFILSGHQYLKLQKFKEAFDVVNSNRNTLTKTEADTFVEPIRLHYFRNEPVDDALKLFSTDEDAISFMKHHDLYPCLIAFLEKLGRYSDAAGVHLERGNVLPAIRLCFKNSSDGRSIRCGEQHLLKELWMKLTFGVKPGSKSWGTYLIQLLDAAKERPLSAVSFRQPDDIDDQIMMFLAIERGDADKLLKLGYRFLLRKDISSAILSLDNAFDNWNELEMNSASDAEIIEILQAFQAYAHLLKGWITKPSCADPPYDAYSAFEAQTKPVEFC